MPNRLSVLALVPVFVNAGAALLPAVVAGVVSVVGLLFRPRALWAACRDKPWRAAGVASLLLAAAAALWAVTAWRARPISAPPAGGIDWPGLARELIAARHTSHAILQPLWHHGLEDEMALATPTPFTDAAGRTTLYVPAMIYTVDQQQGTFWALDALTGEIQWKATRATPLGMSGETGAILRPIFSCPLVVGNGTRIVTGQGLHDNANCSLLCFDIAASRQAKAGRVNWTVPTTLHLESSPARLMVGGEECVVIGAGAIEGPDKKAIGDPGFIFCVSVATGKTLWRHPLNDPEAAVAVDDGVVYGGAGLNGNAVVALRSEVEANPREIWRVATKFPATGDLLVTRDAASGRRLVLLGTGNGDYVNADAHPAGSVMALDAASGKTVWEMPQPDGVLGRLTVRGGRVLAACRDGNAYALDLATGRILWKTQVTAVGKMPVLAGVACDGRYVFALAADATLAVLAAEDGQLLERRMLGDPAKFTQNLTMATPVLADGVVYVATENSGVWAFRVAW